MVDEQRGGYNKTGILLAALSLYEIYTRSASPSPAPPTSLNSSPNKVVTRSATKSGARVHPQPQSQQPQFANDTRWWASAVALGSLIFNLHTLLSDSSTLIAWSWTGWSNYTPNGPMPNLHGSLTLIAQAIGLLIPIVLTSYGQGKDSHTSLPSDLLLHPIWFAYGVASSYVVYAYSNWPGYIGGLNLSIFLVSIIPLVMQRAALGSKQGGIGMTYFVAWLVVCLLSLAGVWTVAYAFVPGGVYLRERTDL